MRDSERVRKEAFERVDQNALDNAADFASGIPHIQITTIRAKLTLLEGYLTNQAEGGALAGGAFENKGTAREVLRTEMHEISRTAEVMEHAFPGIAETFRMPIGRSDQTMLATAKAWDKLIDPHEDDFKAYGLPDDFRTVLADDASNFEATFNAPVTAVDERVAATALIGEAIREGMVALRILDRVMRNKYADQPGKLAAWLSASDIERAPKKKPPATPPTP